MVGGGKQSSNSSSGGFNALPKDIKTAYNTLGQQATAGLTSGGFAQAFTPLKQTADETAAYAALRGNDPIANLSDNIALQMNPFDQYVVDGINREAAGNGSVLQSALNGAGIQGDITASNRGILGANDIDAQRLQQIGQFKQGQYNTALNNALTVIPGATADYANNLAGIAGAQRDLAGQQGQAQINALLAAAKAIGVLPTQEGSSTSKSSGFSFSLGK